MDPLTTVVAQSDCAEARERQSKPATTEATRPSEPAFVLVDLLAVNLIAAFVANATVANVNRAPSTEA